MKGAEVWRLADTRWGTRLFQVSFCRGNPVAWVFRSEPDEDWGNEGRWANADRFSILTGELISEDVDPPCVLCGRSAHYTDGSGEKIDPRCVGCVLWPQCERVRGR